jgi:hypothetical protein
MNILMKAASFLWLVLCLVQHTHAQRGNVTAGGDAHSSHGSVAYSLGQATYSFIEGEAGFINQGLQQPVRFSITGISDPRIVPDVYLYPNPAHQFVFLSLSSGELLTQGKDFRARIYDVQGRLHLSHVVNQDITAIPIHALPAAVYIIQLWQGDSFIQSLSFSKTN